MSRSTTTTMRVSREFAAWVDEIAKREGEALGLGRLTPAQVCDLVRSRNPMCHNLSQIVSDCDTVQHGATPDGANNPRAPEHAPARNKELISARTRGISTSPRRDVLARPSSPDPERTPPLLPAPSPIPVVSPREGADARAGSLEEAEHLSVPIGAICAAYAEHAAAAGLSALPRRMPDDLRDEISAAWAELPDLATWRDAMARLPRCRTTLDNLARCRSLRSLLNRPWPEAARNLWRVLEGDLDDDRQTSRAPRRGRAPSGPADPSPSHQRSAEEIAEGARAHGFRARVVRLNDAPPSWTGVPGGMAE